MVIAQGDVWWADLPIPSGSEAGFHRPVVVVQGDAYNASGLNTVVCVPLTTNLRWVSFPGNILLSSRVTLLPQDSVANVTQLTAFDRSRLTEFVTTLPRAQIDLLHAGIDVLLGRR